MKYALCRAAGIAAAALVLAGCFPDELNSVNDLDTVTTVYDQDKDFNTVTTYVLLDTVVFIDADGEDEGDDEDDISHAFDDQIIAAVKRNLDAQGWTQVTGEAGTQDVTVQVAATTATTVGFVYDWWYYWGWYPYWPPYYGPGWGVGYPPMSVAYAYTTGTLLMTMLDTKNATPEPKRVPISWVGAVNGVLTGSAQLSRITDGIDQAFAQSPYLKGR